MRDGTLPHVSHMADPGGSYITPAHPKPHAPPPCSAARGFLVTCELGAASKLAACLRHPGGNQGPAGGTKTQRGAAAHKERLNNKALPYVTGLSITTLARWRRDQ